MSIRPLTLVPALFLASQALAADAPPRTPSAVVAQAPASAWQAVAPDTLLVMTVEGGRRIVIQLAPRFAPAHVANIRALAKAGWWDGKSVYRVQDNYVAQWGDATEKLPLPAGIAADIKPDYAQPLAAAGQAVIPLPYPDAYAPRTGFVDGWPVGMDDASIWLPHCYGMVGVARNLSPDAGTGAELYAVIGQAPRQLDRNIAVVGRVIEGISLLASLPRGSGELGFYTPSEKPLAIVSARMASDLPEAERPRFQVMDVTSQSFADYLRLRANRKDDFYDRPAGGVELCNAPVPVRIQP
ncbi:peptidylprolyl isomerase [Sphingobium sp. Sx8-8]|uniref:peptidylprolyl isomerase n=1 Tax=Sphingobium sp. Sx8-8 TaxID=2933617 RepID=UPI001F574A45|nr:peptidylprolyl isomerase [Sphingobium sp. Sx8-8]